MAVTLVFLAIVLAHLAATTVQIRFGLLFLIFTYAIYPKLFSLGVSEEGFALSGQRAMLYILFGFYILRALWGSREVKAGLEIAARHGAIFIGLFVYLAARVVGNILSGRVDVGSVAGLVNEFIVSLLVVLLVVTYVRTKQDVITVLSIVVASLVVNQLAGLIEFGMGKSLFQGTVEIQYEMESQSKLLDGRMRGGYFRSRGFFDNPLKLAGFLCLIFPAAIALLRVSPVFLVRVLAGTCLVLTPVTAVITGSRTALAVTALIFLWYAYSFLVRGMGRYGRTFLNVAAVGAAIALVAVVATGAAESLFFGSEYARSTESRVLQFVRVPIALADAPLFGFGFARNIIDMLDIGHVDSFFLHTALEGGIVALAAILYVIYRSTRLLAGVAQNSGDRTVNILRRNLAVSLGFAFLIGLVLSLSDIRFYLFLLIGIAIVLHEADE